MVCERCLDIVINPVEHEFCRVVPVNEENIPLTGFVIAWLHVVVTKGNFMKNLSGEVPEEYVPPSVQGLIVHPFANKDEKPAMKHISRGEEGGDNPSLSLATKLFEG